MVEALKNKRYRVGYSLIQQSMKKNIKKNTRNKITKTYKKFIQTFKQIGDKFC